MSTVDRNHLNVSTDGDFLVVSMERQKPETIEMIQRMQGAISTTLREAGITTFRPMELNKIHITLFNHLNGPGSSNHRSYGLSPEDRQKLISKVAEKLSRSSPKKLSFQVGSHDLRLDFGSDRIAFPGNTGVRLRFADASGFATLRTTVKEAVKEALDELKITVVAATLHPEKGIPKFSNEFIKEFRPHITLGSLDLTKEQAAHPDVKTLNDKKVHGKVQKLVHHPKKGLGEKTLELNLASVTLLGCQRLEGHDLSKVKSSGERTYTHLGSVEIGKPSVDRAVIPPKVTSDHRKIFKPYFTIADHLKNILGHDHFMINGETDRFGNFRFQLGFGYAHEASQISSLVGSPPIKLQPDTVFYLPLDLKGCQQLLGDHAGLSVYDSARTSPKTGYFGSY